MSLFWDVAHAVFASAAIVISSTLDYCIRKSIRDTPEESKTVIAEIHMITSYAHQVCFFWQTSPAILRCIIGPIIPGGALLFIEYCRSGTLIITILTLGYGALVKFGFLVSFGRMSEVSEKVVKRVMYCLCLCWVLVAIIFDLIMKWHNGMDFVVNIPFLNENQPAEEVKLYVKWFDFASLVFAALTHVLVLVAKVRRFVVILPTPI